MWITTCTLHGRVYKMAWGCGDVSKCSLSHFSTSTSHFQFIFNSCSCVFSHFEVFVNAGRQILPGQSCNLYCSGVFMASHRPFCREHIRLKRPNWYIICYILCNIISYMYICESQGLLRKTNMHQSCPVGGGTRRHHRCPTGASITRVHASPFHGGWSDPYHVDPCGMQVAPHCQDLELVHIFHIWFIYTDPCIHFIHFYQSMTS